MKIVKNKKLYFVAIVICIFISSYCMTTVLAAGPSFYWNSPGNAGEYFTNENYSVSISTSDGISSAKFYAPQDDDYDCILTYQGNNIYSGTWDPSSDGYEAVLISGRYTGKKYFKVVATNSGGTTTQTKTYAVAKKLLSDYLYIDNEFRFASPSSNDFIYPYSRYYNCAAYVVGIYDDFISISGGSAGAITFMEKTGSWVGREGTLYEEAPSSDNFLDAIYYSGGHFAKAASWDSYGNIKSVRSKWGGWELIYSYAPNGDDHGDNFDGTYGSPSVYFNRQ